MVLADIKKLAKNRELAEQGGFDGGMGAGAGGGGGGDDSFFADDAETGAEGAEGAEGDPELDLDSPGGDAKKPDNKSPTDK